MRRDCRSAARRALTSAIFGGFGSDVDQSLVIDAKSHNVCLRNVNRSRRALDETSNPALACLVPSLATVGPCSKVYVTCRTFFRRR